MRARCDAQRRIKEREKRVQRIVYIRAFRVEFVEMTRKRCGKRAWK